MMQDLVMYKRMPIWTAETMPEAVQRKHNTKVGTWGKITVLTGELKFIEMTENGEELAEHIFKAGEDNPYAQPQAWHRVEALTDDLEWYLEFYCLPKDYYAKKYGLTPVHSEVLEAAETVKPGKALDLGCGQGRNALFLDQLGFDVTAVDVNPLSLNNLASIIEEEDLNMLAGTYDINSANLTQKYDFIVSTVVFMFLNRETCKSKQTQVAIILSSVLWIQKAILVICLSLLPLRKESYVNITRIGTSSNIMKI